MCYFSLVYGEDLRPQGQLALEELYTLMAYKFFLRGRWTIGHVVQESLDHLEIFLAELMHHGSVVLL